MLESAQVALVYRNGFVFLIHLEIFLTFFIPAYDLDKTQKESF